MHEQSSGRLVQMQFPWGSPERVGGEEPTEEKVPYHYHIPFLRQIRGVFNNKPDGELEDVEV